MPRRMDARKGPSRAGWVAERPKCCTGESELPRDNSSRVAKEFPSGYLASFTIMRTGSGRDSRSVSICDGPI